MIHFASRDTKLISMHFYAKKCQNKLLKAISSLIVLFDAYLWRMWIHSLGWLFCRRFESRGVVRPAACEDTAP